MRQILSLQRHGGHDNAHTDMEFTTFYFEVQEKFFKEGLDCFANFFINPLILEDTMKREKKAVHSGNDIYIYLIVKI